MATCNLFVKIISWPSSSILETGESPVSTEGLLSVFRDPGLALVKSRYLKAKCGQDSGMQECKVCEIVITRLSENLVRHDGKHRVSFSHSSVYY